MAVEIITTDDGSHSLFDPALDETYHSRHGAIRESEHVFIEHGLKYFVVKNSRRPVRILEVGFGTGLNALLALKFSETHQIDVQYSTIEAFPIPLELAEQLNYADDGMFGNAKWAFAHLHRCAWNATTEIGSRFTFTKFHTKLEALNLDGQFDVVFYDAFAPSKQPGMWTNDMLHKVVERMDVQSVFVTYCAKGQVKRDLAGLGLKVDTLPGPPGKKEMTRGTKA